MKRRVIAVDLDDTLADTTTWVVKTASKDLGIDMEVGDITDSAYWAQYDIDNTRAIKLVEGYNLAGFPGLQPIPEAQKILQALSKEYELHVITSRTPASSETTFQWVEQFFPDIFAGVILAGNHYTSRNPHQKSTLCHRIGASLMIDDNMRYLLDCHENVRDYSMEIIHGIAPS
jgi:5'(3')-deoxyribonucleotidase